MFSIVQAKLENPAIGNLGNMESTEFFGSLASTLISFMLVIGGILLLIMILKGGIEWMTAGGDKVKAESARKTLSNAVIGIVILFSFFAIVNLIGYIFGINFFKIEIGEFNISFSAYSSSEDTGDDGSGGCFVQGTKITMADGSTKDIELIKPGDFVYSYDTEKDTLVENEVEVLVVHKNNTEELLQINFGLVKGVTSNHIVWENSEKKWVRAGNLKLGDSLLSFEGNTVKIKSVIKDTSSQTVYNLHLKGVLHNFFADNVLVHNIKID